MNLLEKRAELLKLKKQMAWISSEWYSIEKNIDTNFIYTEDVVRHINILYSYLVDLIAEIKLYKEHLNADYIHSVNAMSNRIRMILKEMSENRIEISNI